MTKVLCVRKAPFSGSNDLIGAPDVVVGTVYSVLDCKPDTDMMSFVPLWARHMVDIPKGMWYKLAEIGDHWYHESLFAAMSEDEEEKSQTQSYDRERIS